MIVHRPDSIVQAQIRLVKEEIAADDYQIIKAVRLGVDVDKIYPEHRATYQQRIARLEALEQEAAEIKAAKEKLEKPEKKK